MVPWEPPSTRRCDDKVALTESRAINAARRVTRRTGELLVAYRCYDCGHWHIGHADKAQKLARQTEIPAEPEARPTTGRTQRAPRTIGAIKLRSPED
jgi:hypothetical protein